MKHVINVKLFPDTDRSYEFAIPRRHDSLSYDFNPVSLKTIPGLFAEFTIASDFSLARLLRAKRTARRSSISRMKYYYTPGREFRGTLEKLWVKVTRKSVWLAFLLAVSPFSLLGIWNFTIRTILSCAWNIIIWKGKSKYLKQL